MRGLRGQEINDVCERFLDVVRGSQTLASILDVFLTTVPNERLRDLCHRQYEVGTAGHDGAPRHAVESGLLRVLHDDEPAFLLHRLQSETAVGAGPGEDRADGALTAFLGQRAQEEVEGHARAMALQGLGQPEDAVPDCQIGARRNEIDVVAFELHPVCSLQNLHRRVAGQQIDHHALVLRIEMLDQHEGHAVVGRQGVEELLEGVETTCRRPQCNDREINARVLRQRVTARLRPGLAGLSRTASCHCLGFREPGFPSGEHSRPSSSYHNRCRGTTDIAT